jgi:hypothetical protein
VAAVGSLTVTTADTTNSRRDLVYVTSGGTVTYLAGTAAVIPDVPSLPSNAVGLAIIEVPANATQIDSTASVATGKVTDMRMLLGSVLYGTGVPSSSLGQNGFFYFRADGSSSTTHIYFKSSGAWAGIA